MNALPRLRRAAALATLLALPLLSACQTFEPVGDLFGLTPEWRAFDTETRAELDLAAMADSLADADVVFLGENHDSAITHELQQDLTALLIERHPDAALSLEMFERDVQADLDLWLAGELDEDAFLADARPWKTYHEFYRPSVLLAQQLGLPVLAANVPRPLASRVYKEGLEVLEGEEFAPREVDHAAGRYRTFVEEMVGGHQGAFADDPEKMDRFFASQCVKDDAMAESIADHIAEHPGRLVVHWCGRFHSDHRLGTVERLAARRPDLTIAVVSTRAGTRYPEKIDEDDWASADVLWLVRE